MKPIDIIGSRISDRAFNGAALGIYTLLCVVGLLHHEMWRDEVHAWLIASHSESLTDLLQNLKYEGHPPFYYILLFDMKLAGLSLAWVPWLNLCACLGAATLLLFRSPFSRPGKCLLLLSSPLLFYFALLSRSYSLVVFLGFAIVADFPRLLERPISLMLGLILLANCHLYGLMLSIGLALGGLQWARPLPGQTAKIAAALYGLGIAATLVQMRPAQDLGIYNQPFWHWENWRFLTRMRVVTMTLMGLEEKIDPFIALGVGALALALSVLALRRSLPVAWAWSTLVCTHLCLLYLLIPGNDRHSLILMTDWITLYWLALRQNPEPIAWAPFFRAFFLVFACLQAVAGIKLYLRDLRNPWSQGEAVAAYLQQRPGPLPRLLGSPDYAVETVSAYLDQEIYYPQRGAFATFTRWDQRRKRYPRSHDQEDFRLILQHFSEPCILILTQPDPSLAFPQRRVTLLNSFEGAIESEENYWVYHISASKEETPHD